jgi:hypothetical protein
MTPLPRKTQTLSELLQAQFARREEMRRLLSHNDIIQSLFAIK